MYNEKVLTTDSTTLMMDWMVSETVVSNFGNVMKKWVL